MEDDLRTRARHIAFLGCVNNPLVLTGGVKFGQSEGIPYSGILERLPLRKFHRRSLVVFPSLHSFFPALSFALFFARAPLSERLEQVIGIRDSESQETVGDNTSHKFLLLVGSCYNF